MVDVPQALDKSTDSSRRSLTTVVFIAALSQALIVLLITALVVLL